MINYLHKSINWNNIEPIDNLVIGYFDGLHKGHEKLFKNLNGNVCVLTFKNLYKKDHLYNYENRLKQLKEIFNINNFFVIDLNEFNCTSDEFVDFFLSNKKIKQIIVGDDFKFGSNQSSIYEYIELLNVKIIERNDHYSSTNIKKLILDNEIEKANQQLLIPYHRYGIVVTNKKMGKKLGYPTANIDVDKHLINLPSGIYISSTILQNKEYISVSFIGISQTIQSEKNLAQIETYLIDYNGPDFYGENIIVYLHKKIGEIKKYDSLNELIIAIQKFVNTTIDFFK